MNKWVNNLKVDKQKYIESIEYIREINQAELMELDLSDFVDSFDSIERRKEWDFIGLNNKDYINTLYDERLYNAN